ncbi:uncharacterized protein VTP21DRAFT_11525 [Calcarisporiella thermophila]|uniref:uncharacterized protein n=1 Tax=Calcarisporiella thermophila TaxID=911321 RepID=UPI0037428D8F
MGFVGLEEVSSFFNTSSAFEKNLLCQTRFRQKTGREKRSEKLTRVTNMNMGRMTVESWQLLMKGKVEGGEKRTRNEGRAVVISTVRAIWG